MKINLIYAQTQDGYIGKGGIMPWYLPEDLARFKWLTSGSPVIMGRKTWDSIPAQFRPLPGRRNIVLTRKMAIPGIYQHTENGKIHWTVDTVERAIDISAQFLAANSGDDVWVIGGSEIYDLFLSRADYVYRTTLFRTYPDCDTKAPVLDHNVWKPSWCKLEHSETGIVYENMILKRIS